MTRKQIVLLMLVAIVALPTQAMQRSPEPLPVALSDATLVVHATVESAEAAWAEDEWGRHIWTTYELRVERLIKGLYDGEVVSLRIIGGSVGDRTEMVFDVPRPYLGQEAVFVLEARRAGGPLAVNRSLPVVDGAVALGSKRVPVDRFAGRGCRAHFREPGAVAGDHSLAESVGPVAGAPTRMQAGETES